MKPLDLLSKHFKHEGTGVVNFSPKKHEQYAETITRYGDPRLVISKHPMVENEPCLYGIGTSCYSLHYLGDLQAPSHPGLGKFWDLHDKVCAEFAAREQERLKKEAAERERNAPKTVQVGDYRVTVSLDAAGGLDVVAEHPVGASTAKKTIRPLVWPSFSGPMVFPDFPKPSLFEYRPVRAG